MNEFGFTLEKIIKILKYCVYAFLGTLGLGIIFIIIGAAATVIGLLVVGIMFTIGSIAAVGFLLYLSYENNRLYSVYQIIIDEKDVTIKKLATKVSKSESETRGIVSDCFDKGYLKDYVRIGERICHADRVNETKEDVKDMGVAKCASCGASFSYSKNELAKCPYCGAFVEKE